MAKCPIAVMIAGTLLQRIALQRLLREAREVLVGTDEAPTDAGPDPDVDAGAERTEAPRPFNHRPLALTINGTFTEVSNCWIEANRRAGNQASASCLTSWQARCLPHRGLGE
jgi:hypothetical protein